MFLRSDRRLSQMSLKLHGRRIDMATQMPVKSGMSVAGKENKLWDVG